VALAGGPMTIPTTAAVTNIASTTMPSTRTSPARGGVLIPLCARVRNSPVPSTAPAGLIPSVQVIRARVGEVLREESRSGTGGRRARRVRTCCAGATLLF